MPTNLVWPDITIRLLCTFVAAAIIGYNRGEHGRPAGLRTTAATIWFVTMIGPCFGGGQIALGLVGSATGIVTPPARTTTKRRP